MRYAAYLPSINEYSDPILLAELAYEAEEAGWDGVFVWDHISQPSAAVDVWVSLAAIAMRTKHIKLGPLITPVARRRPWKLARETMTLDRLSNGRLVFGVGLGWSVEEFTAFGEEGDAKIRAEKLDEGLEIIAGLWQGEPVSFTGKHYQIQDVQFVPQPIQTPRIPIWACGAWSPKRAPFRRAARWDGILAVAGERPIESSEVREVRAYCEQHRTTNDPFDVVVILQSQGGKSAADQQKTRGYADAGATWWLEDLSLGRFSPQEARDRIHKGPPKN